MSSYPECEKLAASQHRHLADFVNWLADNGYGIGHYDDGALQHLGCGSYELILQYLEIDPRKLEEERRAMLAALQQEEKP